MATPRSIFVVDNDPSMRRSLERLLREHGFDVELFDSATALLSRGECGDAFCIILDINLDGSSGIELRRRLTQMGVRAPVIFVTGNDSPRKHSAAIESGCLAYLIKPFPARSIIESVQRARELSV